MGDRLTFTRVHYAFLKPSAATMGELCRFSGGQCVWGMLDGTQAPFSGIFKMTLRIAATLVSLRNAR